MTSASLTAPPTSARPRPGRQVYDHATREAIFWRARFCRSSADREMLARFYGIPSLARLYNLTSRLDATGDDVDVHDPAHPCFDEALRLRRFAWSEVMCFSPDEDRFVADSFGRLFASEIAFFLDRPGRPCTEAAVIARARELRLRHIPRWLDAQYVADKLLGYAQQRDLNGEPMTDAEGRTLFEVLPAHKRLRGLLPKDGNGQGGGLEVYRCTDGDGVPAITLVSTISLARVLLRNRFWADVLVPRFNACEVFIRDVLMSVKELQSGQRMWEATDWVSHERTCLLPWSPDSFGWFYDGYDTALIGADLHPWEISVEADVTSPDWRRGRPRPRRYFSEFDELPVHDASAGRVTGTPRLPQ